MRNQRHCCSLSSAQWLVEINGSTCKGRVWHVPSSIDGSTQGWLWYWHILSKYCWLERIPSWDQYLWVIEAYNSNKKCMCFCAFKKNPTIFKDIFFLLLFEVISIGARQDIFLIKNVVFIISFSSSTWMLWQAVWETDRRVKMLWKMMRFTCITAFFRTKYKHTHEVFCKERFYLINKKKLNGLCS